MTERYSIFLTHSAFGWPYTLSPHDFGMVIEDVWPTIFFGRECLPEIRRKFAKFEWAREAVEQMRCEADVIIAKPPQVPIERIGWRHDFYSHDTGEHLLYNPDSPDEHLDPWDGSLVGSEAQRRAWALLTHERTFRMMRSLGVLFGLTGNERYAAWVADGMRAAVKMFARDDLREGNNTEALYFQPLYDAQILMLLANSYDLTRDSDVYSEDDHAAICAGIFEAGIPYQIRFFEKTGAHNMTCYVGAALATVGRLIGRDDWVEMGLRHPRGGLAALLQDGLREDIHGKPDGFWFEGTMFYHFYSLCPLVTLWELFTKNTGAAEQGALAGRFATLFDAPVAVADNQLRLPTLGDLGAPKVMNLSLYKHIYEYAAGQISPETYSSLLARIYADGAPRNSLTALAYGPDTFPEETVTQHYSTLLGGHGIAVLRGQHNGEDFQVLFKVGPHGTGHDHPDKLHISLTARGHCLAADLGTCGYAVKKLHGYYRSTFAHNTLLVNENSQQKVSRAHLDFQPNSTPHAYALGRLDDAYAGVQLKRELFFEPPYLVVSDLCSAHPARNSNSLETASGTSETEHRYSWVFHAYGSMSAHADSEIARLNMPPLPEKGEFAHFTNRRTLCTDKILTVDWRVAERVWLRLVVTSDGPMEATMGRTPGNPSPDDQGTVLLRATGTGRRFFAAFEVHSGAPTLQGVAVTAESGIMLTTTAGVITIGAGLKSH